MTDGLREAGNAGPVVYTHIGGQALLEGVMMRGKINWAVAVRKPDGGIHVEEHDLPHGAKAGWHRWPVARGVWALYETLALSLKAFSISAQFLEVEESPTESAGPVEDAAASSAPQPSAVPAEPAGLTPKEIALTMVLGVALAVGAFIVLPAIVTSRLVSYQDAPFAWNVVDGVLRLVVFFAYIWAVGRVPDIKRVFAYHGAEHKTIHAYEHGLPLEPAIIQRYETLHVRCGTSFLLMVMVIAILVFSLFPGRAILAAWGVTSPAFVVLFNIGLRILLLPLVAGLAYEVTVKWAGTRPDNPVVKVLLWPGMQLQRMTTREPDDTMVEVAVAALRAVAEREDSESTGEEAHGGAPEIVP